MLISRGRFDGLCNENKELWKEICHLWDRINLLSKTLGYEFKPEDRKEIPAQVKIEPAQFVPVNKSKSKFQVVK
jgi:hypothetical protein